MIYDQPTRDDAKLVLYNLFEPLAERFYQRRSEINISNANPNRGSACKTIGSFELTVRNTHDFCSRHFFTEKFQVSTNGTISCGGRLKTFNSSEAQKRAPSTIQIHGADGKSARLTINATPPAEKRRPSVHPKGALKQGSNLSQL